MMKTSSWRLIMHKTEELSTEMIYSIVTLSWFVRKTLL